MSQLMRTAPLVGALAVIGLFLTACAGDPGASSVNPVGAWSESSDEDAPNLMLSEDGQVSGYDGCNQLSGEWEPTDDGVEFGDLASTQMACEDVDTWLGQASSATISGDTMTVLDESGEEVGTLQRDGDGY